MPEWRFEGPCPNCGHDDSRHEWGGGGYSNVSIMYCEVEGCDCAYWDGQDKPDDPLGWTGGKRACHVYLVAAAPIPDDQPDGDCLACGSPLRDHSKRVSKLVPPEERPIVVDKVAS